MVTVKDLIKNLSTLYQDMPVYWGVDEQPCWVVKRDKTIEDFPMRVEVYLDKQTGEYIPTHYLYFADYTDYEQVSSSVRELEAIPKWIRWIFNR